MDEKTIVRFTILQLVEATKVDRQQAYGLVQFLLAKELVKEAGTVPRPPGQKGRGQIIYEMTLESAGVQFLAILAELSKFKVVAAEATPAEIATDAVAPATEG